MSELINLHFGAFGIGLADDIWRLYYKEHGLSLDGQLQCKELLENFSCIFNETS